MDPFRVVDNQLSRTIRAPEGSAATGKGGMNKRFKCREARASRGIASPSTLHNAFPKSADSDRRDKWLDRDGLNNSIYID